MPKPNTQEKTIPKKLMQKKKDSKKNAKIVDTITRMSTNAKQRIQYKRMLEKCCQQKDIQQSKNVKKMQRMERLK